ncbi:very long chain fatty acid elongase 7-like isoform X3 [Babylonia areolata]
MRDRPAWDLKGILVPYNFALVALSAYMCCEFLFAAVEERYSLLCQDIDFSLRPNALRMLNVCWWYYFSKYIELTDTVCFILRKKNGQITFLHVYHHATMIPFWWMSVAYIPGGQTFFHPLLNTGVHVIMYTYYGLAALGPKMQPYLWWKKYLTSMQLIQFLLIGLHTSYNLFLQPDCPFPKGWEVLALAYAVILIVLFANFYRQAYVHKTRHHIGPEDPKAVQNGKKSE